MEGTGEDPKNSPVKLAEELVAAFDRAWAKDRVYKLNTLRKVPTADAILKAPGVVQVCVAIRIVDNIGAFAARGKEIGEERWFTQRDFPWGSVYLARSLMKMKVSFKMEDFERIFGKLVEIGFISATQFGFVDPLIGMVEKEQDRISVGLRELLEKMRKMFLGESAGRLWPPDAADLKAGQRIERLLSGGLEL